MKLTFTKKLTTNNQILILVAIICIIVFIFYLIWVFFQTNSFKKTNIIDITEYYGGIDKRCYTDSIYRNNSPNCINNSQNSQTESEPCIINNNYGVIQLSLTSSGMCVPLTNPNKEEEECEEENEDDSNCEESEEDDSWWKKILKKKDDDDKKKKNDDGMNSQTNTNNGEMLMPYCIHKNEDFN